MLNSTFDDPRWRALAPSGPLRSPRQPATGWDEYPAADDLLPWRANGIMAGRGWIYAPNADILETRLRDVINEDNAASQGRQVHQRDETPP